ncbi:ubiquitin carboxyl-terminal hydrolase 24 [Anopheles sinensis]|uniref:Ubiquitin carboxyl-terminal hydrolase 24 n=1 Tax=Anopheles sinensis TaxID=74873 RepID=A0A084VJ10_ANOSI|nr:ubiquitin carboxyl-terminal hydrolase 24 [Anopheles sinensis]
MGTPGRPRVGNRKSAGTHQLRAKKQTRSGRQWAPGERARRLHAVFRHRSLGSARPGDEALVRSCASGADVRAAAGSTVRTQRQSRWNMCSGRNGLLGAGCVRGGRSRAA